MNERIQKLYDQAIVIEDGGDYVRGELDPVKFAELIVQECKYILLDMIDEKKGEFNTLDQALTEINDFFGTEE